MTLNYFNNNVPTNLTLNDISQANPTSGNVNINGHQLTNVTILSHSTNGYIKLNTLS